MANSDEIVIMPFKWNNHYLSHRISRIYSYEERSEILFNCAVLRYGDKDDMYAVIPRDMVKESRKDGIYICGYADDMIDTAERGDRYSGVRMFYNCRISLGELRDKFNAFMDTIEDDFRKKLVEKDAALSERMEACTKEECVAEYVKTLTHVEFDYRYSHIDRKSLTDFFSGNDLLPISTKKFSDLYSGENIKDHAEDYISDEYFSILSNYRYWDSPIGTSGTRLKFYLLNTDESWDDFTMRTISPKKLNHTLEFFNSRVNKETCLRECSLYLTEIDRKEGVQSFYTFTDFEIPDFISKIDDVYAQNNNGERLVPLLKDCMLDLYIDCVKKDADLRRKRDYYGEASDRAKFIKDRFDTAFPDDTLESFLSKRYGEVDFKTILNMISSGDIRKVNAFGEHNPVDTYLGFWRFEEHPEEGHSGLSYNAPGTLVRHECMLHAQHDAMLRYDYECLYNKNNDSLNVKERVANLKKMKEIKGELIKSEKDFIETYRTDHDIYNELVSKANQTRLKNEFKYKNEALFTGTQSAHDKFNQKQAELDSLAEAKGMIIDSGVENNLEV